MEQSSSTVCSWRRSNETKQTLVNALPAQVKKVICVPCPSIEDRLLHESKLSPESDEYALLKTILFEHLTFDTNKRSSTSTTLTTDDDRYGGETVRLHAIVAGSYAAYLGRAVKKHDDVDVFVIAPQRTQREVYSVDHFFWLLNRSSDANEDVRRLNYKSRSIVSVRNFGKVQLILKRYEDEEKHDACLCDFHLHSYFFWSFHHCTRWRLDVFKGFFLVRYMCLEDENVICRKTTIGIDDVDKRRRRRGGNTMSNNNKDKKDEILKLYPYKHVNNVLDFGPPKLSQQALHTILKNARGDDPDACATREKTM